jgi:hypothetical protein
MKIFKKTDLYLIGGLLLGFLLILLVISFVKKPGNYVTVSVDGVVKESFPLSEDAEVTIEGYDGGVNTLIIKDGKAYVADSSCPDHLCEKMGQISSTGQSVICLPNRVVIEITGDDPDEYDAIVGG